MSHNVQCSTHSQQTSGSCQQNLDPTLWGLNAQVLNLLLLLLARRAHGQLQLRSVVVLLLLLLLLLLLPCVKPGTRVLPTSLHGSCSQG